MDFHTQSDYSLKTLLCSLAQLSSDHEFIFSFLILMMLSLHWIDEARIRKIDGGISILMLRLMNRILVSILKVQRDQIQRILMIVGFYSRNTC